MAMLSRRQFLGSAAGAAALGASAHVSRHPAWAQAKEVRVLAWSHFVPAYDKWIDGFADQWGAKNGVKVTIDHVPHLQIPAKIAAEIATQSGHDIVQLVGTGTEKWGASLLDVQDLADKIGKKYGGWTPWPRTTARPPTASSTPSRTSSSTSRGSTARTSGPRSACRMARQLGGPAQGWNEAQGQGLPHRDRPRPPR